MFFIALISYIQWRDNTQTNILNNYKSSTLLMILKISYNVYTTFARRPITSINFIDELIYLIPMIKTSYARTVALVLFIASAFCVSVFVSNLIFIIALLNATSVTITLFIVPSLMYIIVKNNPKYSNDRNANYKWKEKFFTDRKWLAWIIMVTATTISVLAIIKNTLDKQKQ